MPRVLRGRPLVLVLSEGLQRSPQLLSLRATESELLDVRDRERVAGYMRGCRRERVAGCTWGIGCLRGPGRRLNFIEQINGRGLSVPIVLGLCKLTLEKSVEVHALVHSSTLGTERGGDAIAGGE